MEKPYRSGWLKAKESRWVGCFFGASQSSRLPTVSSPMVWQAVFQNFNSGEVSSRRRSITWGFFEDSQMAQFRMRIFTYMKNPLKLPSFVGGFRLYGLSIWEWDAHLFVALAPRVTMEAAMAMATERLFNKAPFVNVQVAVGAASSKDVNKNSMKSWHGKNMWGWFTGTMILTCFEFVWMGFHSIKNQNATFIKIGLQVSFLRNHPF